MISALIVGDSAGSAVSADPLPFLPEEEVIVDILIIRKRGVLKRVLTIAFKQRRK